MPSTCDWTQLTAPTPACTHSCIHQPLIYSNNKSKNEKSDSDDSTDNDNNDGDGKADGVDNGAHDHHATNGDDNDYNYY